MRRTILLLAGVLLCVVALGSDSPKEYDDKTVYVGLEGTWRLIEWDNGHKFEPKAQELLTLRKGTWLYVNGNNETKGSYRIVDSTCNPSHLDWIMPFSQGSPIALRIFQIDGDTLRIADSNNPSQRPQSIAKSDNISTYKRVK